MSAPSDRSWEWSGWNNTPPGLPQRSVGYLLVVIGLLVVWNVVANLVTSVAVASLVAAIGVVLLLLMAVRSGAGVDSMGLRTDAVAGGLRTGAAAAAVIVLAITAAAVVPALRTFFADDRFIGVTTTEMLTATMVRIPIVTVLAEEVAFRGVLLGMLLMSMSPLRALMTSSAIFGLWHILPGIAALESNPAGDLAGGWAATVAAVAGQVLVTGAAGAGFAWLRIQGRSVAAPIVAHWGLNGAAYITGWLVVRNTWA